MFKIIGELPEGSKDGEQLTKGFWQGIGVGFGLASLGAWAANAASTISLISGSQASLLVSILCGSTAYSMLFGTISGITMYKNLSSAQVRALMDTKNTLKINRDLDEDLTVKADLNSRAWVKATSLFGERTKIEFKDLLVASIIKTQAILRKK